MYIYNLYTLEASLKMWHQISVRDGIQALILVIYNILVPIQYIHTHTQYNATFFKNEEKVPTTEQYCFSFSSISEEKQDSHHSLPAISCGLAVR
jgi:hypothetical protein